LCCVATDGTMPCALGCQQGCKRMVSCSVDAATGPGHMHAGGSVGVALCFSMGRINR